MKTEASFVDMIIPTWADSSLSLWCFGRAGWAWVGGCIGGMSSILIRYTSPCSAPLSWQFHEETTVARFRLQTCKSADKSLTQSTLVECTWPLTLPDTPSSLSEPSETLSEGGNDSRLHLFRHSFYYWCLKKLLFPQIIVLFFWMFTTRPHWCQSRKLKSNWFVQMSSTKHHHQESLHFYLLICHHTHHHMTSNQKILVQRIPMEWKHWEQWFLTKFTLLQTVVFHL